MASELQAYARHGKRHTFFYDDDADTFAFNTHNATKLEVFRGLTLLFTITNTNTTQMTRVAGLLTVVFDETEAGVGDPTETVWTDIKSGETLQFVVSFIANSGEDYSHLVTHNVTFRPPTHQDAPTSEATTFAFTHTNGTVVAFTAGALAGSSGITSIVEDTTPQLGGMLDINGFSLGDGTRKLLGFVEDASAVNYLEIENQATGSGPILRSTGSDTNVDGHLATKGSGKWIVDATLDVQGSITVTSTVDGRDIAADGLITDVAILDTDFGSNGLMVETSSGTYTNRSVIVGSAKLTISNGSGVSGNPSLDFGTVALADLSDVGSKTGSGTVVVMNTSPTIVTPTVASLTNMQHSHLNAAGGGTITEAAISNLGTTVALVADNLSVFATTTSAQLAGVISDETGSGLLTFATSPTFTTDITTPLVIGGTGTTSDLTLQTTSGVGASGADMHFLVGNNGGTEALTILNDGKVGIGTAAPTTALHVIGEATFTGDIYTDEIRGLTDTNSSIFWFANDTITIKVGSRELFKLSGFSGNKFILLNQVFDDMDLIVNWDLGTSFYIEGATGKAGFGEFASGTEPGAQVEIRALAGSAGALRLTTAETTNVDGDVLGRIDFQAPLDAVGTDAILVAASMWAEADDTFSASVNDTRLVFATAVSEVATEKMTILGNGNVGIGTTLPTSLFHTVATYIASSGVEIHHQYSPIINQTSTAGYTVLEIDVTETATGSGEHLLMDLKVDGASRFHVDSHGAVHIDFIADANDLDALEIDVTAGGFGDIEALDIVYATGALAVGEDAAAIVIQIIETSSTGGEIFGLEVLATDDGSVAAIGLKVGTGIAAIHQESGTFINPTTGTDNTTSTDVADMIDGSSGTTTTIFENDNEYILIGNVAAFQEIEFIITTPASGGGISPTFAYSISGAHTFTTFSPTDGTNGFRNSGNISWQPEDVVNHVTNSNTGTFDIRITRTRNTLSVAPILGYAKTAVETEYSWSSSGDLIINSVTVPLVIGGNTTTSDLTFKTTTGVGASGADMHFLVGNNGATEAMTILNSGNVGIGITAPGSQLHVFDLTGNVVAKIETDKVDGVATIILENDAVRWDMRVVGATGDQFQIRDTTNAVTSFAIEPAAPTNSLYIDSSGQVGMGTAAPSSTLHVNGDITLSDAKNLIFNATTGTKIGTATSQKLSLWGVTPIVQPVGAAQVAPAAYATGAFGLDTDAKMQALFDLVVAMRLALVNSGVMKGAA